MHIFIQHSGDTLPTMQQIEYELIKEAIHKHQTIAGACREINISERTAYRRLAEMNCNIEDIKKGKQ